MKKITINDIAKEAQVSISTVSRVMTNKGYVSDEKREAVLRIVKEMNYKPNVFAQSLATGNSMTIGVLTQRISSPIFDTMLLGILKGIEGSGYLPIFADGNWDPKMERSVTQKLLERKVDGLIILGGKLDKDYLFNLAQKIPLIILGREISGMENLCLTISNFQGAYLATSYLIKCGHHQIAHITGLQTHPDASERLNGYVQALSDSGIEKNTNLIIDGDYTELSGITATETLLDRGQYFSAIFAGNDQMAYGAMFALNKRKLNVPNDISIIGFDNQVPSAYMNPPLSTIHFPAMELGEEAGKAILNLIRNKSNKIPSFNVNLVIRDSISILDKDNYNNIPEFWDKKKILYHGNN